MSKDELSVRRGQLTPAKRALLARLIQSGGALSADVIRRRTGSGPAPLSYAQQRLWFVDRLQPGLAAYNIPIVMRLEGRLDVAALTAAFGEVQRRHEVLRTSFPEVSGVPVQRIAPARAVPLPVADLSALSDPRGEAARLTAAEALRPFDLVQGPMLRARLLRLDAEEHVLLFTLHHIAGDGWSIGVLVREVVEVYRALSQGRAPSLPPLPVQYADFAVWEREWLQGEVLDEHVGYWLRQLEGVPLVLELPTDHPRPSVQSFRGAIARWRFPEALRESLRALESSEGVTLFMVLMAAFQVVVRACTGQESFVVGTDLANRNRVETEGLIGFFVNQMPVVARFAGLTTFRQHLRRVREATFGAYAHQDLPFDKLVEALRLGRSLSQTPLLQVKLNLLNFPLPELAVPGLSMRPVEADPGTSKMDLIVDVMQQGGDLLGTCQYRTELFEPETVERLLRDLQTVLEAVAVRPDAELAELELRLESALRPEQEPVQATAGFALSPQQEHLWRHLQRGGGEWFVSRCAVRLSGELDVPRLRRALEELGAREEVLRTTLQRLAGLGTPVQVIGQESMVRLEEGGGGEEGFDLSRGPLVRARLENGALWLSSPSILLDRGGLLALVGKLWRAYGGEPEPEPLQYVVVSDWLNELQVSEEARGGRESWLDPKLPEAALWGVPFERTPEVAWSFRPEKRVRELPAAAEGEAWLLALWQVLLARVTGRWSIVVGARFDGRTDEELQGALGLLERYLPVLGALDPSETVASVAARAERALGRGAELQDVFSWSELERLDGRLVETPYFPLSFELLELPEEVRNLESCSERFEVKLSCVKSSQGLRLELHYDAERLPGEYVEQLGEQLEALLESARRCPERRLSELDLLGENRRRELLAVSAVPVPRELGLHELFEAQVRCSPESVAVSFGGQSWSYRELNERSNRLARHLRRLGVGRDDRMALVAERSLEMVVGLLGVLKAGAAYVPVDPGYPSERVEYMLSDSGSKVVLTREILESEWPESGEDLGLAVDPGQLAYVIYTSGSTGRPKGVMISHGAIVNQMSWFVGTYPLDGTDVVLQKTPFSFDASVWEFYVPLLCGARLYLAEPGRHGDGGYLARTCRDEGVTVLQLVPSLLRVLLEEPELAECRSLRRLFCGGEALSRELVLRAQSLLDAEVINLYGPTEATIQVLSWSAERPLERRTIPLGEAVWNTASYVLDGSLGLCPVGVAGELYVGGSQLARGYLGRVDLTAERFVPDGLSGERGSRLYRTGDLVRYLPEGSLEFLGRVDHQVKVRGFRIELGEIESVLEEHRSVRQAVVVAREEGGTARLVAYVTGEVGEEGELRSWAGQRLPEHMVPAVFVVLEDLPRLPNGKVDRGELAAREVRWGGLDAGRYVAARGPVEELLAGFWTELLSLDRVGATDSFFDLGGHSLLATQVMSRVRDAFQVDLPLRTLFEGPTIAEMARVIEEARRESRTLRPPLLPVPREGDLPLSFAQQRLWFLDQLAGGAPIYHLFNPVLLEGVLDPGVLARSLSEIVRRHESLRTSFPEVDGKPVQEIAAASAVPLPLVDLEGLAEGARQEELQRWIAHEASRPFDLARGPLLRALLLRLAPGRHAVLLGIHHIVCDGWSLRLLLRELAALYSALSQGKPSPLPEPPVQYADFAVWQREWLQGETLEREVDYWRRQLEGAPAVLELPADRPRPAIQSFRGALLPVVLPGSLASSLGRLAQRERVTLFMVLLAGLDALLCRSTGQPRIAVGTPIANRNHAEIEDLVGNFANTLVLTVTLGPELSWRELLSGVRESALGAYAHQDLPFEVLVEALNPRRDLSYNPLFQVLFGLHNLPSGQMQATSELSLRPLGARVANARFDLALDLTETAKGLEGALGYSTDLFDATTAARVAGHLHVLLEGAAADPEVRLSELPILTAPERQQMLQEWSGWWEEDLASGRCLHELFAAWVRRTPGAVALVCGAERLTYGELDRRANRLAHRLLRLGAGPEMPVGLCLERSSDLVAALLGILKAGAAYVPLDPAYPRQRLAWILEAAAVPLLVTRGSLAAALPGPRARIVDLEAEPLDAGEEGPPGPAAGPGNLAYVIFTSGSTGGPKGVQITHRSAVHLIESTAPLFGFGPADTWTVVHSFSFDFSVWEIWGALAHGGRLVLVPLEVSRSPADLAGLLRAESVTVLSQTPSALRELIESGEAAGEALRALRLIACGGEALPREMVPDLLERNEEVWNFYGPTESTVWAAAGLVRREAGAGAVPLGGPLPGNQLLVLDATGQPLPAGVPGELCLAGAGLARGYLRTPGLTAEKFVPHPLPQHRGERLYRTGDLVRRRSDGALEFLGRIDHQVKVRGFRIELGEIESALARYPGVRQALVMTRQRTTGDTRLVAYLVADPRAAAGGPSWRDFLKERLPDYMVPSHFVVLEALPLTAHGKVDRRALPDPEAAAAEAAAPSAAPRDAVEELLATFWSDLLGLPRIGIHDDFFELGGHSLLATRVISRLRNILQIEIPLHEFFEAPTIARLAQRVQSRLRDGRGAGRLPPPLVPLPPDDRRRGVSLSFSQRRLWFLYQLDPASPAYNIPMAVRMEGALQPDLLAICLGEVVRRHEALRTRFLVVAGEPIQAIDEPSPFPLPLIDLSGLPAPRRAAEAGRLALREASRPFDLVCGPLLRSTLLRLEAAEHALLLTIHHIVSDGWSMNVLVEEMSALYQAFRAGETSPLPELPLQYADYAVWQHGWLAGEVLASQVAFWRERLSGAPALIALPTDRPRPPLQTHRGAERRVAVTESVATSLQSLGRREGATLFMTLLAAFQALLARYSGQTDLSVGTPVAGRNRLEIEGLIGFFVNTLVLRADLSADPSFRDLLGQVRRTVLEAQAHQDLPFEKLVEELQPQRSLGHAPLFQVMLTVEGPASRRTPAPAGSGLRAWPSPAAHTGTVKFDLLLALAETSAGIDGALDYSTDLFDGATIDRMIGHLRTLLREVADEPDRRLPELPILSEPERAQLLREWNEAGRERPAEACLQELVAAQARRTPDAVAVVHLQGALTYRELDRRAGRLARHLRALGVGPEDRVGILLERTPELVAALLGVLQAGGAYVPLDPTYPDERLAFLLTDSGASVLLTQSDLAGRVPEQPGLAKVCLDRDDLADAGGSPVPAGVTPRNLAYVIYTSGSTGRPKGVGIEHRSAAALLDWAARVFSDEEMDGVLAATSICFDLSVFELFAPLSRGGRVVLARDALDLPGVAEAGVRLVNTVPSAVSELLRLDGLPSSVQTVSLAGEPLRRSLVEQLHRRPGIRVLNLYGPSEDTTYSTWAEMPRDLSGEPGIGRPIAGTSAHLLDAGLRLVPVGAQGELFLAGVGLARGYLGRPDLTAERFVPDPFALEPGARLYRTGDLARRRPDGELDFLGRLDHQVKVRGFRVELGEVEAVLGEHPQVREASVLAQGEGGDRRLVAYVVPREGDAPAAGDLRSFLRRRLPEPVLPSAFVLLEALPLTPNGKVDRAALARVPLERTEERLDPPRGPIEEAVAAVWSEVLGLGPVGRRSDFFALGGHSLLATRVVSRLRAVLWVDLPLRALFEAPTVAGLAGRVESVLRAGAGLQAPPIEPAPRDGPLPLSFSQERLWFLHQLDPASPAYNMPLAVRFAAGLDVPALERSLGEVVRRHEALRTVFPPAAEGEAAGGAVQVILPAAALRLPIVDLSGLPEEHRDVEGRRLAEDEARRPFDLARGPLLRTCLLRLGAAGSTLLATMHHIVSDGWSLRVLESEVAALYEAFHAGRPSPLPELPLQYADFAVWQRRWLQGEVLEAQLAYWRRQLRGVPPLLPLPAARPHAATSRARGGFERLRLSAEDTESLRSLSRSEGCTLFIVLLAGLQALLCRYTGQTDLCVGSPIAGRNRLETEGLIGCFLNTLALRADLAGNPSFRELLGRVREASLGAYAHQDLPFERLLEELQPERDLQRTPVFQVMFNMLNVGEGASGSSGEPGGDEERTAAAVVKLDLSLHVTERSRGIEILLHYDADLFEEAQMAALAAHLRSILASAAAEPGRRLADLPLESPAERQQRLAGRRAASTGAWTELAGAEGSIAERFQRVARAHPAYVAVATDRHCWTYEQLDRLSSAAARALARRLGDSPRVALLFDQNAPRIAAVLTTLKAGRTYVPLDPSYPKARLAAVLRDADVGGILAEDSRLDLAAELAAGEVPVLRIDLSEAPALEDLPPVPPETPAYILYTSGSTGEPKGVVQSHRNVLHHVRTYVDAIGITPADRLSLLASYAFDASVMDIFGALLNGAALHPFDVRREGTAALARWLREQGITIYHSTPTLYRRLFEDADGGTFPDVRRVVLGGEKCVRRDLEGFRRYFPAESLFVNGLGPTESTLALQHFAAAGDAVERETVPVGVPVADTEVTLRNAAGEQAAVYGIGEIEIRSPWVALGYWRRPDLTAAAFLDDPEGGERRTYRTGDLGRWLPGGSLEFVGRGDAQVKVRGNRIELGEIEAALGGLPGVREAVVVAREEEGTGEPRLAAYVLAGGPEELDPRRLRRELWQRLPEPMIPADFVMVEAWPLTPTGKVDRAALPAPPALRQRTHDGFAWPGTPLEELLCGIWAEVLGLERVGVHDDFFAVGGHSLLATRLLARLRQVWPAEIPLRAVFEAPTVEQLAGRLEEALRTAGTAPRPPLVPVPRQGPLPLSFGQQRLWFLEQLQPGTAAYNLPAAVHLAGALDVAALTGALTDLVRRHEVLRTTFADLEGVPVQVIGPAVAVPLPEIDLRSLPPDRRFAEARRLAAEEARRPFDLARGPLFRAWLLRLEDGEQGLLATFHHVITDGWSQGIFWRELAALHDARKERRAAPLPDLPVQYADFAHWQRRLLTGEVIAGQLAYWRERLRGIPAQLDLPFDRPRPVVPSMRGASRPLSLRAALAGQVRDLGRRTGTTPFMVLLAAFQTVLCRHTSEEDICVGTPIAGRVHAEVEGLIGLFVNTLVMRGDLAGDPSFAELLGRTREAALQAHAHQDLPFEKLVEELQPDRSLGVSPLFQVMLAFQNVRRETPRLGGIELGTFAVSTETVKFDLSLTAADMPDGIGGTLEYAAELFDAATVDRLLGHLGVLLEGCARAPESRLSTLPLLRPEERHQLLAEWGDTAATDPRESLCLDRLVLAQARRTPEAEAVISRGGRLTYGELEQRSARLASRLAAAGVGRGELVPVLLDGGPGLIVALLAVLRAGAAFVPFDPAWPAARRNAILEEIGAGVVLVGEGAPPDLGSRRWQPMSVEERVDEGFPAAEIVADASPGSPIYAIYTSGSTGRPKGVVIPHRGIVNRFLWMDRFFGVEAAARVLQTTRHVYDSAVWQIFWPLIHGGATVLTDAAESADPDAVCGLVERHGITLTDFVPAVFNLLVQQLVEGSQDAARLASLRAVVVGGEEMAPTAARSFLALFPEVCLVNLYGPTEASIGCIYHRVEAGDGRWGRVPIGRPISNVRPVILDRWGSPVPIGAAGELCLSGRCLALSYLRDGGQTGGVFVPNPAPEIPDDRLYRTGDLARRLPDGRIDLLGRIDRQIKIRGLRIELGEIEAALRGHPRVAAAAVLAWQAGPDVRDRLLAACFTGEAEDDELRDFLRERLPAYMVPAHFVRLDGLPLTQGGKVDRRALAGIVAERWRPAAAAEDVAPRTPYEDLLAGIWANLLGLGRVGLEDDFFALGGHSLLATRIVSRIRRVFGIELPIRALFEVPTVTGLARRIEDLVRAGVTDAVPPLRAVPRDRPLPLSFAQQRLWFLDRLTPGAAVYHLFNPVLLEGPLDPGALARSLGEITRRHESLRTTFPQVDGEPVQAVAGASEVPLPLVDLGGLPEGAREEEAMRWVAHEASRPFDLARGPLLRALLLRLAPDRHAVLLGAHHIVCDGWSFRILLRELTTLYRTLSQGEPGLLPELPLQYADFAVWQRDWMRGDTLEREVGFWRRQLEGAPAVLELPADRPRSAVQTFRGARRPVAWPATLAGALGGLARAEGGTLFMTLLTGFDALLLRSTGQPRIVVGTPIANRRHIELEDLIGNFANTLVLSAALDPGLSFRAALARVRETALGAYAHQDLPFEILVEALSPRRDLSYNPLFQVLFGLHNLPPTEVQGTSGLGLRPLAAEGATARFDLALDLVESPEGLRGSLEYSTDLFDATTAERIAGHLRVLLEGAAADPEARLDELPLLTEAERQQALQEWSGSWEVDPAPGRCLHELFEAWSRRTPGAVALVCGGERLTYGDLDRRANRLAHRLRRLGAGPEVPVGLCLARSADLVAALLGILKAGAAYVPLDPAYPRQRLAWILEAAAVPLLVTQGSLAASLPEHRARLVDLDADPLDAGDDSPPGPAARPDNLAYVIFTSGSTGGPKGVQITHRSAVHLMETAQPLLGFGSGDAWTVVHSFSFDFSVWEIWGALACGGRLVVVPGDVAQAPADLAELLLADGVTILNQTPSAVRSMIESGGAAAERALRNLRLLACGGEALPRELVPDLLARTGRVWNFYGPTESTVWAAAGPVGREAGDGSVTLGAPLPDNQLLVLDVAGQPLPAGVPGELCIAGAGLARGYLRTPGLTAEKFVPHPVPMHRGERLYRTGDLVRRRSDGALEFLGRIDQQVKVRGFRIELGEIESALAEHPGVGQAVVTAPQAGAGERTLTAWLVPCGEVPPAVEDLRRFVAAHLPAYMVPSLFVLLERLPLTPNGKVDRRALSELRPEDAGRRLPSATEHEPPRDDLELRLVRIWESLLPGRRVGVHDDFFDLGGHSLLAVRLLARIRRECGVSLPITALFQHSTVERLAAAMRRDVPLPARPVLVEIQPGQGGRPFFLVHPVGGNVLCYLELARCLGPDQPVYGLQAPEPDGEPPAIEGLAQQYVEAVRAAQPRGPYAVGGWSLGGLIAFEMARRLHELGERCEPLVLIDSHAPQPAAADPEPADDLAARFARDFLRSSGRELEIPDLPAGGEPEERLRWLYEQGLAARLLPPELGFGEIRRLFALFRSNTEALRGYAAAPSPHEVVIFRAAGAARQDVDPALGWGRLAGGVELHELPGDHYTILRRPAVETLAQRLAGLLSAGSAPESGVERPVGAGSPGPPRP